MEAHNAARQARLRSLRQTKDQQAAGISEATASSSTTTPPSSSSIHPFRRAFLSQKSTALRPTHSQLQAEAEAEDAADPSSSNADLLNPTSDSSLQKVVDKSSEGQLLRRFRNWDPMTGQARQGTWNTIEGIEDEVKGVQESVLREEEVRRVQELDLAGIAPKRANWDLRRDMDKRLKKLERRDKEARLILIRQRIKAMSSSKSGSNAATAAAAHQAAEVAMSTVARGRRGLGVGEMGDSEASSEEESEEE